MASTLDLDFARGTLTILIDITTNINLYNEVLKHLDR